MLGIIAAMEEELQALIRLRGGAVKQTVCGMDFYTDGSMVAALSGIGKVNAAICAMTMILTYKVDAILNIGSAGGLVRGMRPGDLVVADAVVQHDLIVFEPMAMTCQCDKAMADRLYSLAGERTYRGLVASGDHFISDPAEQAALSERLGAVACDMEAGAIGRCCAMSGVPFAVARGISDNADENASMSFEACLRLASERAAKAAQAYIQSTDC